MSLRLRISLSKYGQICPKRKIFRQKMVFLSFYLYLCMVIDEFQLLSYCSTEVSEVSDMTGTEEES